MTRVKICGLTQRREAKYLNAAGADYAGFVFHPPSKRNVSVSQAQEIADKLNQNIKRVAVVVSPGIEEVKEINRGGFDILQIHGNLTREALAAAKLPVWLAVNIAGAGELSGRTRELLKLPGELLDRIAGVVVDGAEYGGGNTFGWCESGNPFGWRGGGTAQGGGLRDGSVKRLLAGRSLILAGGLSAANVRQGIRLFAPDVVDVSSGVESDSGQGKSEIKIKEFVERVKNYE